MSKVPNDAFETLDVSNASFGTSASRENATFGLPLNRTLLTTHDGLKLSRLAMPSKTRSSPKSTELATGYSPRAASAARWG